MFLRLVSMNVRTEQSTTFSREYDRNVVSALRRQHGCCFAALLQNTRELKDCVSLTIWESKHAALEYERSGAFMILVESLRPFYEASDEMELKLSDDLSIEYTPVRLDPSVRAFDERDTEHEYIKPLSSTPYAVTIITVTVQQERIKEFQEIFADSIVPKFSGQKGFVHIILLRNGSEFNILSFWDETIDLNAPDGALSLQSLIRSIYGMLPPSVQWQVSHKVSRSSFVSTQELSASVYRCLTGAWFDR